MANTIDHKVLQNDGVYYRSRYLVLSDGTAMSDVVMIDKSTLTHHETAKEPAALDLEEIVVHSWGTLNSILLEWDHTTDDEIIAFGTGAYFGITRGDWGAFMDPRSAGGTGDIVITSNGLSANAGFMIFSTWKLRPEAKT